MSLLALALLTSPSADRAKVPLDRYLFPHLHLASSFKSDLHCAQPPLLSPPAGTTSKSHLPSHCTHHFPPWSNPPLSPGPLQSLPPWSSASAPPLILHRWPEDLFECSLGCVTHSSLVAHPTQRKGQVSPEMRHDPASRFLSHPLAQPFLPPWLLTVSRVYRGHCNLRSFALAISLFWNDLPLSILEAHIPHSFHIFP